MKSTIEDGGFVFGSPGGQRTVGALAAAGTSVLVYAVSPGLRADLGGFAALVGDAFATGDEGFVLPFGAFAPVVYFFAMVAQVFVAPIRPRRRGPHQRGHSKDALHHRGRRGEAREEHPRQARAIPGRGRPPPRAGGAGLPARLALTRKPRTRCKHHTMLPTRRAGPRPLQDRREELLYGGVPR